MMACPTGGYPPLLHLLATTSASLYETTATRMTSLVVRGANAASLLARY